MSFKRSLHLRFWLFFTGVLLPIAAVAATYFLGGSGGSLVPQLYQSGEAWAFAGVLLGWSCLTVMIPLMLFCVCGLTIYAIWPTSGRHFAIRASMYTGALLSSTYLIIAVVAQGSTTFIAAVVTAVVLVPTAYFSSAVAKHWRRFSIAHLLALTTVLCFLLATMNYLLGETGGIQSVASWLGAACVVSLVATPALTCLAYVMASYTIFRSDERLAVTLPIQIATWLGIAAGWYVSWRAAVDLMFEVYSSLPTNRNCYVTSAAANGHPSLVGGQLPTLRQPPGNEAKNREVVTLQMQRCKFVEICLVTACPKLHARVRKIYDKLGPPLAKLCGCNVWFADAAFLMCKPIEWVAILLRCVLRIPAIRIREIYRARS